MKLVYTKENILRGIFIYSIGDTIATFIGGNVIPLRILGMMALGGSIYAFEIPNYFMWIEKKVSHMKHPKSVKTALALCYFNPLWIARHIFFIRLFSNEEINISIFNIAFKSYLGALPLSIIGNFIIQNILPIKYRFIGSAMFSGFLAIYYALSALYFL
jgi:hypothetical protein